MPTLDRFDMEAMREGNAIKGMHMMTPHAIPGKRLQMANFKTLKSADKYAIHSNRFVSDNTLNARR
jgi:hypothetical protein